MIQSPLNFELIRLYCTVMLVRCYRFHATNVHKMGLILRNFDVSFCVHVKKLFCLVQDAVYTGVIYTKTAQSRLVM
jgi:hypothetical protein